METVSTGWRWRWAMLWPIVRTVVAALVPFIPMLTTDFAGSWEVTALTVGLSAVLAVASALVALPDDMSAPWWLRTLLKGLRQFGQMVVAAGASAVLLTDVQWSEVLPVAAGSALATLVLAALSNLPNGEGELLPVSYVTDWSDFGKGSED